MKRNIIIGLVIISILSITACTNKANNFKVYKDETYALGTFITIKIYSNDKVDSKVFEEVFLRIRDIENRMTINKNNSEIVEINNVAGKNSIEVSEDTLYVIEKGKEYSHLTDGRFDLTVGPLVKLWSIGFEGASVPAQKKIDEAIRFIDYNKVIINKENSTVMLENEHMGIDLGGIAKGYAADEVVKVIKNNGYDNAIINLGGNVLCYGGKPDGSVFKVGIQNPFVHRGDYIGIVSLTNQTVVTSGTYERFFEKDGIRYHHILDTSTGYSVQNELESVSIITQFSIDADALSTGVFSMGLEKGYEFIENIDGIEAIFVTSDKKIYLTTGAKAIFKLTDKNFKIGKIE